MKGFFYYSFHFLGTVNVINNLITYGFTLFGANLGCKGLGMSISCNQAGSFEPLLEFLGNWTIINWLLKVMLIGFVLDVLALIYLILFIPMFLHERKNKRFINEKII